MKQPFISIIIPTYHRLGALAELLEALHRQTYKNFEVIIVNDGGPSVASVVVLYPELQCTYKDLPDNKMHVHARNRGLELATGELIMLCDDDDLIVPEHIERMVAGLGDNDLVYADVEIVQYSTDEQSGSRKPISRQLFAYDDEMEGMRKFSTFMSSGCLYRRSIHDVIGYFDETIHHYWDWDFYLRVVERFRVRRVPVAGVLYAFSPSGGNMSGDLEDMRLYLDKLSAKHGLGWLPTKNFFLLLEEPGVKNRVAKSEIVWDGLGIESRME
ncbi:MAG: glycosyltransferase family 2 protein [Paenibacillaceae bacterium]